MPKYLLCIFIEVNKSKTTTKFLEIKWSTNRKKVLAAKKHTLAPRSRRQLKNHLIQVNLSPQLIILMNLSYPSSVSMLTTDIFYTFHGIEKGCLTLSDFLISSVITTLSIWFPNFLSYNNSLSLSDFLISSVLDAAGKNNSKKHGNETLLFV